MSEAWSVRDGAEPWPTEAVGHWGTDAAGRAKPKLLLKNTVMQSAQGAAAVPGANWALGGTSLWQEAMNCKGQGTCGTTQLTWH